MSDFHDSDYYKRQRIIFHGIVNFVAYTGLISTSLILVIHLLYAFHITQRDFEGRDIFFFVIMVAMLYGVFYFYRINNRLEKFDAEVLKKKQQSKSLEVASNNGISSSQTLPNRSISDFPELLQALEDKQITQDGTLKVPRSEFVLYCHDHDFFGPRNKESGWKPIDGLLKDSRHRKPLTSRQFRQSYQDLGRDGKVPID